MRTPTTAGESTTRPASLWKDKLGLKRRVDIERYALAEGWQETDTGPT